MNIPTNPGARATAWPGTARPGSAMTVGELSRRTGVPVKKLREYTDMGLIYTIGRSPTNYRLFDAEALWCVRWIGELRALGLTVAEIRAMADAHAGRSGVPFGRLLAERLKDSRRRLQARIDELQQTLARIDAFEAAYHDDLTPQGDACWDGDPRCPLSA